MPGRQRRVATEVDLNGWCEPSQWSHVFTRYDESGFGEIVLCGNGLEHIVRQPRVEDHDGCGIATEQSARERIDLIERKFHIAASVAEALIRLPAQPR